MHALSDLEIRGLFRVDYTNTLRIQLPRYSEKNPGCTLVSVRLWNFKDGGSEKVSFLAKNQHTTKENFKKNPKRNVSSSKIWHNFRE